MFSFITSLLGWILGEHSNRVCLKLFIHLLIYFYISPFRLNISFVKCHLTCRWHAVASWTWDAQDETCGICRMAFDGCCPDCKFPGDDCPLSKSTRYLFFFCMPLLYFHVLHKSRILFLNATGLFCILRIVIFVHILFLRWNLKFKSIDLMLTKNKVISSFHYNRWIKCHWNWDDLLPDPLSWRQLSAWFIKVVKKLNIILACTKGILHELRDAS